MGLLLLLLLAALLVTGGAGLAIARHLRRPPAKTYAVALARGLPTSPAHLNRQADEVTFRLSTGHDSPGWIITGDRPAGPTVIMLHGFGDSRYGELTWAHLLLPHAGQLVLFDLPGHGEATARVSHLGAREADDVIHLLDQVETAHGVVLFGYSMGAGIAIAAAARQDPRIKGVIADGPYRYWHQPVANFLRARRWPASLLLPATGLALRLLDPGWRAYDRLAQARQVACPLLVLHGCVDPICDYNDAVAIVDAAPHGRLVEFTDAAHLDLAHHDETRYRTALQSFFATPESPHNRSVP